MAKISLNEQVQDALVKITGKPHLLAQPKQAQAEGKRMPRLVRMDVIVTRRDKDGNLQAFSIAPVYEK